MITRNDVISDVVMKCLKEIYTYVVPKVNWDKFTDECKAYNNKYKSWENYNKAFKEKENKPEIWIQYECTFRNWENKSIEECIGPKPFEFYYLPKEIINDIVNSYIYAYRLDQQQELLDTIEILKKYCQEPIIKKYIKEEGEPGYKGYEHPDNLEKEIDKVITNYKGGKMPNQELLTNNIKNKFFEFLDMAGNFFNWNSELNTFNMSIYLGSSPNSNKETVIENWKKYRNLDIEINDELIKKEYYGDDE